MNLAEYQNYISKDVDTALKINISWAFFLPGKFNNALAAGRCYPGFKT